MSGLVEKEGTRGNETCHIANIKVETYSIAQLLPLVIRRSLLQPRLILRLIGLVSGLEGCLEIRLQFQNRTNLINLATYLGTNAGKE